MTPDACQLPPRVLYGYIRVDRGAKEHAVTLKADLLSFCRTYGYLLGTVFTDWGVEDAAVARPGFSSLIDVCTLVGSHGVLVASREHLSKHGDTLAVLLRQVQRTGAKLIVADEVVAAANSASTSTPATADAARTPADGTDNA